MNDINSFFYLFDPYAKHSFSMSDLIVVTSAVFEFSDRNDVQLYLCTLSSNLRTHLFDFPLLNYKKISVEKARACVRQKHSKERV